MTMCIMLLPVAPQLLPICVCLYIHVSAVLLSDGGGGGLPGKCRPLFGGYQNTMKTSEASLEIVYVDELIKG